MLCLSSTTKNVKAATIKCFTAAAPLEILLQAPPDIETITGHLFVVIANPFFNKLRYLWIAKCAPVFIRLYSSQVRFSALSKVIFDYLINSQFKYSVFDYLLNSEI